MCLVYLMTYKLQLFLSSHFPLVNITTALRSLPDHHSNSFSSGFCLLLVCNTSYFSYLQLHFDILVGFSQEASSNAMTLNGANNVDTPAENLKDIIRFGDGTGGQ